MSNPKNLSLSDANQALQDVAEAVDELKAECYRLRAELKTSNAERDELRRQVETIKNGFEGCCYACEPVGEMNKKLLKERDAANSLVRRILSEINCRIEHGADSNGHLEGLHGLYKKETLNG